MGERSLDLRALLSLQGRLSISETAATDGVSRFALRLGLFGPAAWLTGGQLRFGNVGPGLSRFGECFCDSGGVVAFVCDNIMYVHVTLRLFQVDVCLVRKVFQGVTVADVHLKNLGGHDQLLLQVDRVIRLVGCASWAIFPLG
jgi:hypothetical protein